MAKVSADRKLELVRTLRMQNHYNRQLFRTREGILYSQPDPRYGELYGLEGETGALPAEKEKPIAGSFRIRFVITMALLLFFILCDLNHLSYGGETTDSIYGRMIKSPDFSRLLEFDKEDN